VNLALPAFRIEVSRGVGVLGSSGPHHPTPSSPEALYQPLGPNHMIHAESPISLDRRAIAFSRQGTRAKWVGRSVR
jgi:hypothetical protein